METTEKKCAICSHVFSGSSLQCPKCGSGVFEAQKTQPQIQDKTNPKHSETPQAKTKSGWLSRFFGKSNEGKSLYWGPTKLDILCISIQVFDMQHFEALDTDIMMNVIDRIIPEIKNCKPKDVRLSHATNQETAFTNASKLLNETALSEGALIYGEMGVSLDDIAVYFALSIIAGGGKKNLVTIMKKSTHWSENLQVR